MLDTLKLAASLLRRDRRGVTAVEYAVVAGAIVAGVGAAFVALSGSLTTFLSDLAF